MDKTEFSDSELLILGLIAEMPRHGYELEGIIEKRAMREWTQIGFSSIYYVLKKLEKRGLIIADIPESTKARKRYQLTEEGTQILEEQTMAALKDIQPTYPSLLMGMVHLSVLSRNQVLEGLQARKTAAAEELVRIQSIHFDQQPLPDYVDAIFDYSRGQLEAEMDWIDQTLDYMKNKTWLT
jgi:DNA-binding PadR family transcriptional regulator